MTKQKRGLGRGLDALLPTDGGQNPSSPARAAVSVGTIPLTQIEINPFQPRQVFDEITLNELADSIRVHGIIQPITVRKIGDNQYQLISGERRFRASKIAELKEVPAYIRTANDEQMLEMALIENIQREDLDPVEVALSYQRLIDELGLKQDEVGGKVGKERSTVTNYLALLKLPDTVKVALRAGDITMGHAKTLKNMGDPVLQLQLFQQIRDKHLSVRQAEDLARLLKQPKTAKTPAKEAPSTQQMHLDKIAKDLENKFGNKVKLSQQSGGKGDIVISFSSNRDLERILDLLNP
ncbi:MAG: ParB/RepB/Spo0J family partition protein [Bacteroidia bacterium]|nr:ParB/RepB/Spo0J family partition protein [Bacteroidia bacterium]